MNKNNTLLHKMQGYRHGGWVAPAVDSSAAYAGMVANLASYAEGREENIEKAKVREEDSIQKGLDREVMKGYYSNLDASDKARIKIEESELLTKNLEFALDLAPLWAQPSVIEHFDPGDTRNLKAGIESKVTDISSAQNRMKGLRSIETYDNPIDYMGELKSISASLEIYPADKTAIQLNKTVHQKIISATKVISNDALVDAMISQLPESLRDEAKKIKSVNITSYGKEYGLMASSYAVTEMMAKSKATQSEVVAATSKVYEESFKQALLIMKEMALEGLLDEDGKSVFDSFVEHWQTLELNAIKRVNELYRYKPEKTKPAIPSLEEILSGNDKDIKEALKSLGVPDAQINNIIKLKTDTPMPVKIPQSGVKGSNAGGEVDFAVSYDVRNNVFLNAEGNKVYRVDKKSDAAKSMIAKYEKEQLKKPKEIKMPFRLSGWRQEYRNAVKAVNRGQAPSVDKYLKDKRWTPQQIEEAKKQTGFQEGGVVMPQLSAAQVSPEETTDLSNLDVELDEILGAINELTV